jgi:hypothetical protein
LFFADEMRATSQTETGRATLLYTEECQTDCREGRATPSVHGLTAGLTMVWDVDEHGTCRIAEHILSRTIIRFLKVHHPHRHLRCLPRPTT